jgi:hypothetical protein
LKKRGIKSDDEDSDNDRVSRTSVQSQFELVEVTEELVGTSASSAH